VPLALSASGAVTTRAFANTRSAKRQTAVGQEVDRAIGIVSHGSVTCEISRQLCQVD